MKILLTLLSFLLIFSANAQKIGIMVSPTYSFFEEGIDGKPGIDISFVTNRGEGNLRYQMEAGYSMTRAEIENFNLKYEYIKFALLPKYFVSENINLHAGPRFGYLINGKLESEDIENTNNAIHLSAIVGIGYNISDYEIGIRGNIGISDLGGDFHDNSLALTATAYF